MSAVMIQLVIRWKHDPHVSFRQISVMLDGMTVDWSWAGSAYHSAESMSCFASRDNLCLQRWNFIMFAIMIPTVVGWKHDSYLSLRQISVMLTRTMLLGHEVQAWHYLSLC
jgi:hypothetical protein